MSIEDEYEILSRIELFESLESVQLKRLIFVSQRYQLQAGEYLFRQNDACNRVFAILQGECSVLVNTNHGEIALAVQGVGDLVGEMAAISGEPRNASIRANTACEVIGFEASDFISTVTNHPDTALMMMKILSERMAILRRQLDTLRNKQLNQ
ncbi:Crp/Fnr family transcriptional regulator [Granulosicoccus antarcticus]|uniref:Cyclic nucleotide-gated potassium channel n=1 Tax=Granulosicoccus antarcticus IMCC3135 TaxID=1192854 RepID=A0A2Z2NHM6_9GAMM|nr:Crp/Fnr family transcriptional regulator [Granulosicoccus antarcticus]ASJ70806.1 Cyclic nucleotide-gated potassium channel [Granulosicoccus antarcticus IMCC3135]